MPREALLRSAKSLAHRTTTIRHTVTHMVLDLVPGADPMPLSGQKVRDAPSPFSESERVDYSRAKLGLILEVCAFSGGAMPQSALVRQQLYIPVC